MLGILIKKELLDNLYSLRFHISSVIVVLLMLISVLVLKQDYEARMATYMENRRAYLEEVQEKDSYFFLMFSGIGVDRPPAHLSIFYTGVEKNPNRKSTIRPFFKPEFTGELNINPVFPLFPALFSKATASTARLPRMRIRWRRRTSAPRWAFANRPENPITV